MSLCLIRLRWLNRVLALSPKGCYLPPRSHQKNRKEWDEASRERNEHNQEKTNPIKSPKLAKMELKVANARRQRRTCPKSKALASKNQSEPLKMLQWRQKSLLGSWNGTTLEEPEETSEKNEAREGYLKRHPHEPVDRFLIELIAWSTVNVVNASIFCAFSRLMILPLPFSVEIPNFLCPMAKEFWFLVKIWPFS